jgi:HK97 family phage major capsid protein
MSTLRHLREQRAKVAADLKALHDSAGSGDLTAEQRTRWDALRAEADALTGRIERAEALDDMERRQAGQPLGATGDARLDREFRSFNVARAVAKAAGLDVDAGRETELQQEMARRSGRASNGVLVPYLALATPSNMERRVVTTGGTPAGASLIQTTVDGAEYIDALRAQLVIAGLGARYLTGLTSGFAIPRLKTSAQSYWTAENSAVTASDQVFEQVQFTPRTVGALTEVSRLMLLQAANPGVDAFIKGDLVRIIAQALDIAAINGQGAGANQPTGILGASGVGLVSLGTNGAAPTYDNFVDLMGQIQDANAAGGAFLSTWKVFRAAAKLKDSQNRPLGVDTVFQGQPRAFTTNVPANLTKGTGTNLSAILYGDFAQLFVAMWGDGVDVLVNPYATSSYAAGNVQLRALCTCDVELRDPQSFAKIVDATA